MPPKLNKCSCDPDTVAKSVRDVLGELLNDFSNQCMGEVASGLEESMAVIRSLFQAQSTMISQLQSESVILKSEISELRTQLLNSSLKHQCPPRLSTALQKPLTDKNRSFATRASIHENFSSTTSGPSRQNNNNNTMSANPSTSADLSDSRSEVDFRNVTIRRSRTSMPPVSPGSEPEEVSERTAGLQDDTKSRQTAGGARGRGNRRPRTLKTKAIVGSGGIDERVSAAASTAAIHVSRVNLRSTGDDIVNFITKKIPSAEIKCEELKVQSGTYRGFKLVLDSEQAQPLLSPSFWPTGIRVKKFFAPKKATANFQSEATGEEMK